ncbi:MAG: helix-turn-helix domain-containing protein [Pseudomonadota bacterium]|nr:helix-turn-helix domain-containing protein [Pseudomonadota bacterium]
MYYETVKFLRTKPRTEAMTKPNDEIAVLTIKEVATLLKMSISAVNESCIKGELPSIKVGRRRLVPRKALLEYIEKNQFSAKPRFSPK